MCAMPQTRPPARPFVSHGPTAATWVMPAQYAALDRIEREVVEDVAAAILSAKLMRRGGTDGHDAPAPGVVAALGQLEMWP